MGTDNKRMIEQLISSKAKIESSDKLKSEFLAQISHEIRTPINSILSYTNLLKTEVSDGLEEYLKNSFDIIVNWFVSEYNMLKRIKVTDFMKD